ncbi:MAG: CBS domain-containing protein [Gammaproteobacteria bacterium]
MTVRKILDQKGGDVLLAERGDTITKTVAAMCERGVGSAIVIGPDGLPLGILTERDVLRQFARHGEQLGRQSTGELMSSPVHTTTPDASIESVMELMTRHRFRHVPVVEDNALVGIISIGDVVKARLKETEAEAESMRQYIATSY